MRPPGAIDVVGTGGDGSGTLNISTTAALVVAAAGVPVAKHGNRAITSKAGSADVLDALGVRIDHDAASASASLHELGFAFLFAPNFHPAMKHAGPTRREIGVRTAFNLLGPLTNPAGTARQVIGVGDPAAAPRIAEVARLLGTERTFVVHGDGVDELPLDGSGVLYDVTRDGIDRTTVDPLSVGLRSAATSPPRGGHARGERADRRDDPERRARRSPGRRDAQRGRGAARGRRRGDARRRRPARGPDDRRRPRGRAPRAAPRAAPCGRCREGGGRTGGSTRVTLAPPRRASRTAQRGVVLEIAERRRQDVLAEVEATSLGEQLDRALATPAPRPDRRAPGAAGAPPRRRDQARLAVRRTDRAGERGHRGARTCVRGRRCSRDLRPVRAALVRRFARRPARRPGGRVDPGPRQGVRRRGHPAADAPGRRRRPGAVARRPPPAEAARAARRAGAGHRARAARGGARREGAARRARHGRAADRAEQPGPANARGRPHPCRPAPVARPRRPAGHRRIGCSRRVGRRALARPRVRCRARRRGAHAIRRSRRSRPLVRRRRPGSRRSGERRAPTLRQDLRGHRRGRRACRGPCRGRRHRAQPRARITAPAGPRRGGRAGPARPSRRAARTSTRGRRRGRRSGAGRGRVHRGGRGSGRHPVERRPQSRDRCLARSGRWFAFRPRTRMERRATAALESARSHLAAGAARIAGGRRLPQRAWRDRPAGVGGRRGGGRPGGARHPGRRPGPRQRRRGAADDPGRRGGRGQRRRGAARPRGAPAQGSVPRRAVRETRQGGARRPPEYPVRARRRSTPRCSRRTAPGDGGWSATSAAATCPRR